MPRSDRIPEHFLDFFERPILAHLATLMPDGSPQVTPLWISYEAGLLVVNTFQGRIKDKNLSARARVALDMVDPDDPYRYLSVRGRVIEATLDGAAKHIDQLALKYLGTPYPRHDPNRPRKMFKIKPDAVVYQHRIGEVR